MFANIALLLTFAVYVALISFSKIKPPGGDYAVGYAWSFLFLGLALFVTSLLATIAIGWNNGFAWAPGQSSAPPIHRFSPTRLSRDVVLRATVPVQVQR